MGIRKVKRITAGIPAQDGAGVKLNRVISKPDAYDFDPFLLLDAFDSQNPDDYIKGFPWHPHRGIETITYIMEGNVEHGDSLGNKGYIKNGGCQWMTAGSGIIHQEMPRPAARFLGLQLWLNLPQKFKMAKPAYRDITADLIPKIREDGVSVGVVSGYYKNHAGAVSGDYVKTIILDVTLEKNVLWGLDTEKDNNLFVYILGGSCAFDTAAAEFTGAKQAVLLTEGSSLSVKAGPEGARFMVFAARPLKEEIAWGGPIVMNTRVELHNAFTEIDNGTFIKDTHPREVNLKHR